MQRLGQGDLRLVRQRQHEDQERGRRPRPAEQRPAAEKQARPRYGGEERHGVEPVEVDVSREQADKRAYAQPRHTPPAEMHGPAGVAVATKPKHDPGEHRHEVAVRVARVV